MSANAKKYPRAAQNSRGYKMKKSSINQAFIASSTATAQATVAPTMGLLPVATAFTYHHLLTLLDVCTDDE